MSLIASYRFNKGTLLDQSGNGNHGTLTPGAGGFRKTSRGLAMLFDGAATYISSNAYQSMANAFTITAWVRPKAKNSITLIGLGSGIPYIALQYMSSGKPIIILNAANYKYFSSSAYNTLVDGKWHHVVFIVTGSGRLDIADAKMYVDSNNISQAGFLG